jgi:hypothetical protein
MRHNFVFGLVLVVLAANPARTLDCADLAASKPDDLVQFLQTQARHADPDCVARAIVRLGDFRAPSGVEALVDLLDFQRPESPREKAHLFDMHDKFPAVSALLSVGMPAVPVLIARLQSGQLTDIARSNGVHAVALIYRDNPPRAIAFRKAAASAKSQEEAARLESCARDAIRFCSKTWHSRCEAALGAN